MSLIQPLWLSTSSQLRAISFTPRFAKIIAQHLNPAKLSGAHWSIVSRVGEEDG